MTATQREVDPRVDAMERARESADRLYGDIILLPIRDGKPDWDRATWQTITAVGDHYDEISIEDIPRLAVITDGFHRFTTEPSWDARVATWLGGDEPEIQQIEGDPSPAALALIRDAAASGSRLIEIRRDLQEATLAAHDEDIAESLAEARAAAQRLGERIRANAQRLGGRMLAANDNEPRQVPLAPPTITEPLSPAAAGGLLADIATWITSTAIVPVPELSMVSAAALLAGMFGDGVLGPTRAGINLYITTLLDTAGGKGHPPKAIRTLGDASGRLGAVVNGDHTSYAAIERTLRRNKSTVITMDEFGITLQDVNGKHKTAPAASIRKFLLAVYDQANSKFDGRIYASDETKKDSSPIDGPALTVLGMTTPETLYAGLSEASVSDGFINRFMFLSGAAPEEIRPPKLHRDGKPPAALVEALRAAVTSCPPASTSACARMGKAVVPFDGDEDGEAYARWAEVFMWQHHADWSATERGINGRAAENTIRLATIRALSRNPASPAISADDVTWGWSIVHASIELVTEGARRHMSASPAEALRKAIIAALEEAAGYVLPISKLMERRGVRGADMRELTSALMWLQQSGEVTDISFRGLPGKGSKFKWNPVRTA